jgi:gamma-glutamyltranspeptidase / glutathione hydrolase
MNPRCDNGGHASSPFLSRRAALALTGKAALAGALTANHAFAADATKENIGAIAGEPTAEKVGRELLARGGNAVDAAVAAALAAGVASPHNCGPGGYGGHMVLALDGGRKITAIDFNSAAPAAMGTDVQEFGWLSAGVPGTLAGLQLALDRFGTRRFAEVAAPAIRLARDGFPISAGMASGIRAAAAHFRKDEASARLFLADGEPLQAGVHFRNPDLANLLETLAERGSVASFYRGDIAKRIAAAFKANGGLVTGADLAAYEAREVTPLRFGWHGFTVLTAPLTAGGLTTLEALNVLKHLDWENDDAGPERTHARVEALRATWHDRLTLLGDPGHAAVPVERLLSDDHARQVVQRVRDAVKARRPIPPPVEARPQGGTIHLSCADRHGNLVAVTLTHGVGYGARVTVDGLGLVLGHGMSRFEPKAGHPNSAGPRKRPLNNMCPTLVLREGRPVLAIGGAGGRRIPNALFDVLTHFTGLGATIEQAMAAPRLHTEGDLNLRLEKSWPEEEVAHLQAIGYKIERGNSAKISAAWVDTKTGASHAMSR